jgi:hypothetical protein
VGPRWHRGEWGNRRGGAGRGGRGAPPPPPPGGPPGPPPAGGRRPPRRARGDERHAAEARAAALARVRDESSQRLARLGDQVDAVAQAQAQAQTAHHTMHTKIASPGLPPVPATAGELRRQLAELREAGQRGEWDDFLDQDQRRNIQERRQEATGLGEEGSHTFFELTFDAEINQLGPGEALTASGDTVAFRTCEQHEPPRECELELLDTQTGERRTIDQPLDGDWTRVAQPRRPTNTPRWNATSTQGLILLGLITDRDDDGMAAESYLVAIDPDTPDAALPLHRFDGFPPSAAWDRTGQKIVSPGPGDLTTRRLTVIDLVDNTTFILEDAIPPGHHVVSVR